MLTGIINTLHPRRGEGWPQTVIVVAVLGTMIYLVVTGQEVPGFLQGILGMVVGYFFGREAVKEGEIKK